MATAIRSGVTIILFISLGLAELPIMTPIPVCLSRIISVTEPYNPLWLQTQGAHWHVDGGQFVQTLRRPKPSLSTLGGDAPHQPWRFYGDAKD